MNPTWWAHYKPLPRRDQSSTKILRARSLICSFSHSFTVTTTSMSSSLRRGRMMRASLIRPSSRLILLSSRANIPGELWQNCHQCIRYCILLLESRNVMVLPRYFTQFMLSMVGARRWLDQGASRSTNGPSWLSCLLMTVLASGWT